MKLSIIKSISLTFMISALSLPTYAKINDDNPPQADASIQEKFNLVQGYWKNKCITSKFQSVEMYFHFKKINKENLLNTGKIKLFTKENCLGKFIVHTDNRGTTINNSQLSSMQVVDNNHIQDKYNQDMKFTRITKTEYDKLK